MEKSTHKKNFDPEHMSPQEQLKFEIAEELGLKDRVSRKRIVERRGFIRYT